jgi:hypothetical protein
MAGNFSEIWRCLAHRIKPNRRCWAASACCRKMPGQWCFHRGAACPARRMDARRRHAYRDPMGRGSRRYRATAWAAAYAVHVLLMPLVPPALAGAPIGPSAEFARCSGDGGVHTDNKPPKPVHDMPCGSVHAGFCFAMAGTGAGRFDAEPFEFRIVPHTAAPLRHLKVSAWVATRFARAPPSDS